MLNLGRRRVFLCRKAVDMRKAYDSLADLVRIDLGMDPFQGDVFVFIGKDCTRAKVLIWEASGFWLCAKRLETARFRLPLTGDRVGAGAPALPLTIDQVMTLLEDVIPRMLRRMPMESL
ncbi:MAG: IS66 family insertion sequence element accessory protein TnpB [Gemmatimonadaceae bacterium]|nr:IS66 family insertion sequence element accessory protein TnpB [Gemmatimonadaceae bacterium]